MKRSVTTPCSTGVSLFRGLYARVARGVSCDVSYISRVARRERKSKVVEEALNREFDRVLALIKDRSIPSHKNRTESEMERTSPRCDVDSVIVLPFSMA